MKGKTGKRFLLKINDGKKSKNNFCSENIIKINPSFFINKKARRGNPQRAYIFLLV
jgi:uncharacterized protein Veg